MLSTYNLYDLHYIFVLIRAYPDAPVNGEVLACVIDALSGGSDFGADDVIRGALRRAKGISSDGPYSFAFTANVYSYHPHAFLKDGGVCACLIHAAEELRRTLDKGCTERIYDLADALHNLPVLITENGGSIPEYFWECEVKHYRKKWDKTFLKADERALGSSRSGRMRRRWH